MHTARTGRERDTREIAMLRKAQQVGLLLQGELGRPLEPIEFETLVQRSRREIIQEREQLKRSLRPELARFCAHFDGSSVQAMAELFDELLAADSRLSMPYADFVARLGRPRGGTLRGALPHSTVRIDPTHGLQTEFPEMHLVRDLGVAFGDVLATSSFVYSVRSHADARRVAQTDEGRETLHRHRLARRTTLLACFNLVEAYVNSVAWNFLHRDARASTIAENDRRLLAEDGRPVNLRKKLVAYPRIVAGADEGPLHDSRDPLRTFLSFVQPYRDSIVHASPFAAPDKFGGYEKLSKLYELDTPTCSVAVQVTLHVISEIHRATGGRAYSPRWADDFVREPTREWFEWEQQPWVGGSIPLFEK